MAPLFVAVLRCSAGGGAWMHEMCRFAALLKSGRQDLNLRPSGPPPLKLGSLGSI